MLTPLNVAAAADSSHVETMTAGDFGGTTGFNRTFFGSITPDTDVFQFDLLNGYITTVGSNTNIFIAPINIPNNDASWSRVLITGDFGSGIETFTHFRRDFIGYTPDNSLGATLWEMARVGSRIIDTNIYTLVIVQ